MSTKDEREAEKAKLLADLEKETARKIKETDAKFDAINALPEGVPMPRYTHGWGDKGLYGIRAGLQWEGSKYDSLKETGHVDRTLADALALLDSIARGGRILELHTVKDACLAIKPERAITDKDRERADIEGPFYGVHITRDWHSGAKLKAYVDLANGFPISVDIGLLEPHKFGGWRREYLGDVYARGRQDRGDPDSQSVQYIAQPASLAQQKTVKYSGGSSRGTGSASRMVYLFDNRAVLDTTAALLARKGEV